MLEEPLILHPTVTSGWVSNYMRFFEPEYDDYVAKAVTATRKEVKCLKDEMSWPPQPSDLEPEKFKIPSKLNEFLTNLFTVKGENEISSRSAKIWHSLAQDIVYIVTSRRVKTPKVYYYQVSSKRLLKLQICLAFLGYFVSYSILNEIHAVNAYFIQKQQSDEVILPINTAKKAFKIYVGDNIDRNEETLPG